MKNFADYEFRKSDLLKAYEAVLAANILPIDETGTDQVRERRRDLEVGHFLLAVCGRIKSGKSTILNALLFRSMVLPTDDTPHTAKNTLIEYGERSSLEITFYSAQEWSDLAGEISACDPKTAHAFAADLEAAAAKGVFKDEWVRSVTTTKRLEGIAALHEYITPIEKGGRFTPFVKEVRITYPHAWLRSVSIVDTPGVDDPCKFREDLTKKFVTRAGAVLYVTYAGQAMAQPDFDFLNNYLLHVARERRVIAVNKADTLEGGSGEVEAYINCLQNHPEPSIREVFGAAGSVSIVSALGGLIAEMIASGEDLTGDLDDFYRPKLEKAGFLDSGKNGIEALRLKVEERLVTLEGQDILKGHASFLKSLIERKRRQNKSERSDYEDRLSDLGKTNEDLQAQIKAIKEQVKEIENMKVDQRVLIQREADTTFMKLRAEFSEAGIRILDLTRQELEKEPLVGTMSMRAAWHFTTSFHKETPSMTASLNKCLEGAEQLITAFAIKACGLWSRWESSKVLDSVMDYSTYKVVAKLKALIREMASASSFEAVSRNNTGWFQRTFNTEAARAKSRSAILEDLRVQLLMTIDSNADTAVECMRQELLKHLDSVARKLSEVQERRRESIERLLAGKTERDNETSVILGNLMDLEAREALLGNLEVTIADATKGLV